MMESAQRLSELALLFSKASSALGTLEAIEEILAEYAAGEIKAQEALEEIGEMLEEFEMLETLSNLSPEEMASMLGDDDDDDEPPSVKRMRS